MRTEEIQTGRLARVTEGDDLEGGPGRVAVRTRTDGDQAISARARPAHNPLARWPWARWRSEPSPLGR